MDELWKYILKQIEDGFKKVPKMFRHMVAENVINLALDLTYYATKLYTNKKYYQ